MGERLSERAKKEIRTASSNVAQFARLACGVTLRPYQKKAAEAIIRSVFARDGKTFILIFSRQSGKDELLAIVTLFLLFRFMEKGGEIVCAQPTFKPQTVNAMERILTRGNIFGQRLTRKAGYILQLGKARATYYSAERHANQVGATADRLLVMNEAQDIPMDIFDKRFSPMTASGNATKVFSGTSWTSQTLLSREKRRALEEEARDGVKRVFVVEAEEVGKENSLYALHVEEAVKRMGREHPFIRTQYFCEEIDNEVGMFPAGRMAVIFGEQCPVSSIPVSSGTTIPKDRGQVDDGRLTMASEADRAGTDAFLIDVAGQDEARMKMEDDEPLKNPGRDSTRLSIVQVDTSTMETLQAPTYHVVERMCWTGENHLKVFGQIKVMVEKWKPMKIVLDATGVGEGLWTLFEKAFGEKVVAVKFTQVVKSDIGWQFLGIIETGRFRDHCATEEVREQYGACQSEILPGPGKILRWGVPDGTRGANGETLHDDIIMADALVAILDQMAWYAPTKSGFVKPLVDPMEGWEHRF